MRGRWVLATMAFLAVVAIGAKWSGYPTVARKAEVVKPKLKPGDGFSDEERLKVQVLQEFIVTALDDLEPTRGSIHVSVDKDGNKVRYMSSGTFGMSRVSTTYAIEHADEKIIGNIAGYEHELVSMMSRDGSFGPAWLKDKPRLNLTFDVPHLVVSASGKPLADDNIGIVWRQQDESLNADLEIVAAMRKNLAAANLGQEFAFEVPGHRGWAKPLKLTKKECLSCHPGMKVGDTVAISAYFSPTDREVKAETR